MFFPLLNQEEKEHCLSLLIFAANCDNHYHSKEKNLIAGYSLLMGIAPSTPTNPNGEEIIQFFSQKLDIVKRAVFLETLGLIESDSIVHPEEDKLIKKIADSFGFSTAYIDEARVWIKEMLPLYYRGFELLGLNIEQTQ